MTKTKFTLLNNKIIEKDINGTLNRSKDKSGQWVIEGINVSNIKIINIGNNVNAIGKDVFRAAKIHNLIIGNNVTQIGSYAFDGCYLLNNFKIPISVTQIGSYAFDGCKKITNLNIPDSVTEIGIGAFQYSGLKQISIGKGLKSIPSRLLFANRELTTINLGNSIKEINEGAFLNALNLEN